MMQEPLTWKDRYQRMIKRHKKKRTVHSIMGTVIALLLLFLFMVIEDETPADVSVHPDALFTATMVGDLMTGRHVQEITDRYGYEYLFRYVHPYFSRSDYVTGNFEHPVILGEEYPEEDKYI